MALCAVNGVMRDNRKGEKMYFCAKGMGDGEGTDLTGEIGFVTESTTQKRHRKTLPKMGRVFDGAKALPLWFVLFRSRK